MINPSSHNYSRYEQIKKFFYPKSIAVIGASNNKEKIGGYIFSQILKKNKIGAYPINIKEEKIQKVKAYPRLTAIPKPVDLTIIAIPSAFVLQSIEDCINSGCKNIIIISAGFKETGEEGKEREEKLKQIIKENSLNVIGPNCLGISNSEIGLNCSFAKDLPEFGGTALISQSGAVIDGIIDWSFKHKIGFSKIVSLGNMAGIDELSMLQFLKDDPKTTSIVFYMETLEKGKIFADVLREVSKVKPVIIIKPGKSENAKAAIGSHTGSLAQDNELVEVMIKENNGILVDNLNELFNILIALKANRNAKKELVIVTNAGGPGVISTDIVSNTSFELYKFSEEEKAILGIDLPKEASLNNPIDILGDGKSNRYSAIINSLSKHQKVSSILVLLTPQIMTDSLNIAKEIVKVSKDSNKMIFSCFLGDKEIAKAVEYFDKNNFANFQTPSEALIAMDKIRKYKEFNYDEENVEYHFNETKISQIRNILKKKSGLLSYELSKEILSCFGINMPVKKIIKTVSDVDFTILDEDKKYVIKADGPNLIHKKEFGAIAKGINYKNFKQEAKDMFLRLESKSLKFHLTLEEFVEGSEVIVGLKENEELGNFIMFGMGGTYVNLFKDVKFSSAPLTKERTDKLVKSTKVYELLKGYRGSKPINFKHLYEVLIRMSYLQKVFPEIKEVDLNPIICNEKGVYLVDVKLLI